MLPKLTFLAIGAGLVLLSTACKKSNPAPAAPASAQSTDGGNVSSGAESAQVTTPQGEPTARPDNPNLKAPPPGPPMVVRGVTINVDKLEGALRSAPYSVFQYLDNVRYSVHYEDFNTALMDCEKIMQDPGVTGDQKTVISGVMEQVKQAAATPPQ